MVHHRTRFRHFFARPKELKLSNPNLQIISIQQKSSNEIDVTIVADNPALFVWLEIPRGISGYFSRNGFHTFDREILVTFTLWTSLIDFDSVNIDFRITSLYNVTQP
jgi:hypothetical protein